MASTSWAPFLSVSVSVAGVLALNRNGQARKRARGGRKKWEAGGGVPARLFVSGLPRKGHGGVRKRELVRIFSPYCRAVKGKGRPPKCKVKVAVNAFNHCLGFAYVEVDEWKEAIEKENNVATFQGNVLQVSRSTGKRDCLFQDMPAEQRAALKLDSVSLFSITDMATCRDINELLRSMCLAVGGNPADLAITDACACVGGNVISFAGCFQRVHAVEIDATRSAYLKHNVEQVCGLQNVTCIHADYATVYRSLAQSIVFFDPPWGGTGYTTTNAVEDLPLGHIKLVDFCLRLWTEGCCACVVARVPTQYDALGFCRTLTSDQWNDGAKERPLPFKFQLGPKANLLIACFPPRSHAEKAEPLVFGDKALDALIQSWRALDAKSKVFKAKFFDYECDDWVRLGAWHGVTPGSITPAESMDGSFVIVTTPPRRKLSRDIRENHF